MTPVGTFTFELQPDEQFRAQRQLFQHRPVPVRRKLLVYAGILMVSVVLGVIVQRFVNAPSAWAIAATGLIFLCTTVGAEVGRRVEWRIRAYQLGKQSLEDRSVTYSIHPERLSGRFAKAELAIDWSGFRAAVETPEFIILYCTPGWGYYLPLRALAEKSQLAAIRQVVEAGVPSYTRVS